MSRMLLRFVIFFAVAITILSAGHYYVWLRLVRDPLWPTLARHAGTGLILAAGIGLPATLVVSRFAESSLRPLVWALYVWMGFLFLMVVVLGAGDLIRVLGGLGWRLAGHDGAAGAPFGLEAGRRLLLVRLWAGFALLTVSGGTAIGMHEALVQPPVRRLRIELGRLPRALSGTTIVQLTDLHVGSLLDGGWLEEVVNRTNALSPDVVVITGDLVDGSVPALRDAVASVGRLHARYGVYFVTGNHEYYSGVDDWVRELRRLGLEVLHNERVVIGTPEASYDLAGIDDATAHQFGNGHGADLGRALTGYDRSRELVLLAHQPKAVAEAAASGVGLVLSGHTHGGQIWPWGYLVRLTQPFVSGFGRVGNTQIYVSSGTGFWGPPIRLGAPPEITLVELVTAAPAVVSAPPAKP
jgi:uncharacterized protein